MNVCIARQSVRARVVPLFLPSPVFIPFSSLFPYSPYNAIVTPASLHSLPLFSLHGYSSFSLSPPLSLFLFLSSYVSSPISLSLLVYQCSILFVLSPLAFLRLSFVRHVLSWIIVASSFLSFRFTFPSFFPRRFLVLLLLRTSYIQRVLYACKHGANVCVVYVR